MHWHANKCVRQCAHVLSAKLLLVWREIVRHILVIDKARARDVRLENTKQLGNIQISSHLFTLSTGLGEFAKTSIS